MLDQAISSLQAAHMDEAVDEVFRMMMGVTCEAVETLPAAAGPTLTAVVGLAGAISGTCILRADERTALSMAGLLMGTPVESLDETVADAAGEICNMLSGTWKRRTPDYSAGCMLSVPTVVTGKSYSIHSRKEPDFRFERFYRSIEHAMSFSILCEAVER
jgi:chemotaxis protein CheX